MRQNEIKLLLLLQSIEKIGRTIQRTKPTEDKWQYEATMRELRKDLNRQIVKMYNSMDGEIERDDE